MARLTLYISNELAARLNRGARQAGLPLSRYVRSLLSPPRTSDWPAGYFETACGFLHGDFPEPADRLPEASR